MNELARAGRATRTGRARGPRSPTQLTPAGSGLYPEGHSQRKEPSVSTQSPWPQTPGFSAHSFTSAAAGLRAQRGHRGPGGAGDPRGHGRRARGSRLTFSRVPRAWDRPEAEGTELLKSSWTGRGGQTPGPGRGRNNGAAERGDGRSLTAALPRAQLAGAAPALPRPPGAAAPGLGGVESFGPRALPGLQASEAETPPGVCGRGVKGQLQQAPAQLPAPPRCR